MLPHPRAARQASVSNSADFAAGKVRPVADLIGFGSILARQPPSGNECRATYRPTPAGANPREQALVGADLRSLADRSSRITERGFRIAANRAPSNHGRSEFLGQGCLVQDAMRRRRLTALRARRTIDQSV